MDSQNIQARRLQPHNLAPYRSTSDLLPKCRSEALRARHAAARSKLNIIARQLYEIKYDHQWEQRQLQLLVDRGDSLEKQVSANMERVREVEVIAGEMEDFKLGLAGVGKEGGLGSQRSTQPEVEQVEASSLLAKSEAQKESNCQTGIQSTYAAEYSPPKIKRSSSLNKQLLDSSKMNKSALLKPNPVKKSQFMKLLTSLPIGNITIFALLLFVLLSLL